MKYRIKTITRILPADLQTPVGIYLKVRDLFPQSALLESSDYHTTQNSFSFIGVETEGTDRTSFSRWPATDGCSYRRRGCYRNPERLYRFVRDRNKPDRDQRFFRIYGL